eukprot:12445621-Alexandrium_andersonii.AAC.1
MHPCAPPRRTPTHRRGPWRTAADCRTPPHIASGPQPCAPPCAAAQCPAPPRTSVHCCASTAAHLRAPLQTARTVAH